MSNARAILIALFALTSLVFAQSSPAQSSPAQQASSDPIKITAFPNAIFKFRQGSLNSSINLRGDIAGCTSKIYDGTNPKLESVTAVASTRVIDQIRKGKFWYTVFQTVLNSGCNVQGICGAASNVSIVWLKLDTKLKVISRKAVIVVECLTNTSLTKWIGKTGEEMNDLIDPKLQMQAGKLELEFQTNDYTRQKTVSSLRYDRRLPEKGLVVSSKTFPIK
jgi:hypothetical protein